MPAMSPSRRREASLGECVACPCEVRCRQSVQAQLPVFDCPFRVDRIVVPLPYGQQLLRVEIVGATVGRVRLNVGSGSGLYPRSRRAPEVPFQTEIRPSVNPRYGRQTGSSAHRIEIEHRHTPPVAVGELHYAPLMQGGASEAVGVVLCDDELESGSRDGGAETHVAGEMSQLGAERLAHAHHRCLVRAEKAVGAGALHSSHRRVVGAEYVILAVYFIYVVSLAHGIAGRDDHSLRTLHVAAEIRFDLDGAHLVVFVNGVDLAVVVEEHGEVVDVASHVLVLPRSGGIIGYKHLHAVPVDVGEYIELPVVIPYAGCPDALPIGFLSVGEVEFRAVVEAVEAVTQEFPVDEVARMEHYESRGAVHGCAGEIIVVADADYVGVGKLVVEEGICKRAVAVVGSPRHGRFGSVARHSEHGGSGEEKCFEEFHIYHDWFTWLIYKRKFTHKKRD